MSKIIEWFNNIFGTNMFTKIISCAIILFVGLIIIKIVMTIIKRSLAKSNLERAAHSLIKSVSQIVMYVLLALIVVSSLGIDVTGIVALASVISLALSLALQNSLTNIIGGFTLLYTHPFHSGDYVEIAGQSGTVKEIGMAYTKLTTPDNKLVQIPNSSVVATEIINYSCTGTRRLDVTVSAPYSTPINKVTECLKEAADIDGILEENGIFTAITGYGEHLVSYVVRVWTPTDKYWDMNFAITQRVKEIFDREGIEMTFSHLNVHIDK